MVKEHDIAKSVCYSFIGKPKGTTFFLKDVEKEIEKLEGFFEYAPNCNIYDLLYRFTKPAYKFLEIVGGELGTRNLEYKVLKA